MEWISKPDLYDYTQEIARAAYADMLHDTERNRMYYAGLRVAVKEIHARGQKANVLDIGTGTGLLSMMAAECGADSVTACEAFEPMAKCAQKIMKDNKLAEKISLIPKRSTDIEVGPEGDMKSRANILVTEVFDTELIGEAALHTFTHAHQCLLERDCIVIPMKATMYAQVVQSDLIKKWNWVGSIPVPGSKHQLHPPPDIRDCAGSISVHDLQLDQLNQKLFTTVAQPTPVFTFDFSGQTPLVMRGHSKTPLQSLITGSCDAVFMWWDLQMDYHNDVILSCAPRWAHPTPSDMQWRDHWMQAIYYPRKPVDIKEGDSFVLHSCYDEYNLWFDVVVKNNNGYLNPPLQPLCTGGMHISCSRGRLGSLQDQERNEKICTALKQKITDKSICLSVSDGSLLPLMAALLGAKHVYTVEPELRFKCLIEKFIESNDLQDRITVINKQYEEITADDLDGRKVDILMAEPYFSGNSLPWHNVHFWYIRTHLQQFLAPASTIIPRAASLYAVAVEFKDLWKIRAPVGDCEGFDLRSFDELTLSACKDVDDAEEPHPLWEYPCTALTKVVPLIRFDFTQPLPGIKTSNRQGKTTFSSEGVCNGVALWIDYEVDAETRISTGPVKPIKPGQLIEWDVNSRQGVHLFNNRHAIQSLTVPDAQQFKYSVTFLPKNGDFKFKFAVG